MLLLCAGDGPAQMLHLQTVLLEQLLLADAPSGLRDQFADALLPLILAHPAAYQSFGARGLFVSCSLVLLPSDWPFRHLTAQQSNPCLLWSCATGCRAVHFQHCTDSPRHLLLLALQVSSCLSTSRTLP